MGGGGFLFCFLPFLFDSCILDHSLTFPPQKQHAQRHAHSSKLHCLRHFGNAEEIKEARSSSLLESAQPLNVYILIVSFAFKGLLTQGHLAHRLDILPQRLCPRDAT